MRGEILTKLLTAHLEGDERAFRKAALALAATESDAGHTRIAEEIRRIVAEMPLPTKGAGIVTDIAQPRGDLVDILEGGHRPERWSDIVLATDTREALKRVLRENRARSNLEQFSVEPRRHLFFYGPSGLREDARGSRARRRARPSVDDDSSGGSLLPLLGSDGEPPTSDLRRNAASACRLSLRRVRFSR